MGKLTHTVKGSIASFHSADKANIESLKLHFLPKQEGGGDPSPTNIRPITGWTGCDLNRAKKNIIKPYYTEETSIRGLTITPTANGVRVQGKATAEHPIRLSSQEVRLLKAGTKYAFSLYINGDISGCKDPYLGYNTGLTYKSIKSLDSSINYSFVWTVPDAYVAAPAPWFDMYIRVKENSTVDFEIGLQMEAGENVTTYEPYSGETIPISWSSHGTEYGGYIDVAKGKLVATYAMYGLAWKNWELGEVVGDNTRKTFSIGFSPYNYPIFDSGSIKTTASKCNVSNTYLNSNSSDTVHYYINSTGKVIYATLPNDFDGDAIVQVSSVLATPIEYDLTPQQMQTFLDYNNFWSDTNDDTEVEYEFSDHLSTRKILMQPERRVVEWNQIQKDGNFSDASNWESAPTEYGTLSINNNIARWQCVKQPTQFYQTGIRIKDGTNRSNFLFIPYNHKILVSLYVKPSVLTNIRIYGTVGDYGNTYIYAYTMTNVQANEWTKMIGFISNRPETPPPSATDTIIKRFKVTLHGTNNSISTITQGTTLDIKNFMVFDLTQMFGLGKEPSTVAEFERLCRINGIDLDAYQLYNIGSNRYLIMPM